MNKEAFLQETYDLAFNDELEKQAGLLSAGIKNLGKGFRGIKSGAASSGAIRKTRNLATKALNPGGGAAAIIRARPQAPISGRFSGLQIR